MGVFVEETQVDSRNSNSLRRFFRRIYRRSAWAKTHVCVIKMPMCSHTQIKTKHTKKYNKDSRLNSLYTFLSHSQNHTHIIHKNKSRVFFRFSDFFFSPEQNSKKKSKSKRRTHKTEWILSRLPTHHQNKDSSVHVEDFGFVGEVDLNRRGLSFSLRYGAFSFVPVARSYEKIHVQ